MPLLLLQELEATRECVDDCCTGTERLRTEYQRLCEGTRDLISTLRYTRLLSHREHKKVLVIIRFPRNLTMSSFLLTTTFINCSLE